MPELSTDPFFEHLREYPVGQQLYAFFGKSADEKPRVEALTVVEREDEHGVPHKCVQSSDASSGRRWNLSDEPPDDDLPVALMVPLLVLSEADNFAPCRIEHELSSCLDEGLPVHGLLRARIRSLKAETVFTQTGIVAGCEHHGYTLCFRDGGEPVPFEEPTPGQLVQYTYTDLKLLQYRWVAASCQVTDKDGQQKLAIPVPPDGIDPTTLPGTQSSSDDDDEDDEDGNLPLDQPRPYNLTIVHIWRPVNETVASALRAQKRIKR